jgi:hypothetical protein
MYMFVYRNRYMYRCIFMDHKDLELKRAIGQKTFDIEVLYVYINIHIYICICLCREIDICIDIYILIIKISS